MRSFGTLVQEAPTNPTPVLSRATEDRFADIVAYTAQQMPSVVVGDRYRVTGTEVDVIALMREAGQVAVYDPTVPSLTWLSQRTFADNFTHLGATDPEISRRAGLATLLAMVFEVSLDQQIVDAAIALTDLLGIDEAYEYLDGLLDFEFAANEITPWSLDTLLDDARLYQSEMADEDDESEMADVDANAENTGTSVEPNEAVNVQ